MLARAERPDKVHTNILDERRRLLGLIDDAVSRAEMDCAETVAIGDSIRPLNQGQSQNRVVRKS